MPRLRLVSIACKDEQDWLGSDEPFLTVGGKLAWQAKDVDAGESLCLEGLPEVPFFAHTQVVLYESDHELVENEDLAKHDKIGEWTVHEQLVGRGEQTLDFVGNGAHYTLKFLIFP